MPADSLVTVPGSSAAPLTYTIAQAQILLLKAAFASFNGSSAASAYLPCLRILSPSGQVVGEYIASSSVAAGGSADVSFGPFLDSGSGSGGELEFELNDAEIATEPAIDFMDGGGVTWSLADDPSSDRVKVSAVVQTGDNTPTVTFGTAVFVYDGGGFNAFPGLGLMTNGNLISVFASTANEQINADLYYSISTDSGASWSAPTLLVTHDTGDTLGLVGSVSVFNSGRVFVAYFPHPNGPGNSGTEVRYIYSDDFGSTWSTPASLTPYTAVNYPGGPALQLANGNILLPVGGRDVADTAEKTGILKSTDNGATWGSYVSLAGTGAAPQYQETTLLQEPGGTIVALITNTTALVIARATSTDNGATWSAAVNSIVSINSGGVSATIQPDNQVLFMLYRQNGTSAVAYRYSLDYGGSWSAEALWETRLNEYVQIIPVTSSLLGFAIGLKHSIGVDSGVDYETVTVTRSRATQIIAGSVTSAGAVQNGHGFTSARSALGKFRVTFSTSFAAIPACTAAAWATAAHNTLQITTNPSAAGGNAPSVSAFDVWITDSADANFIDAGFDFVAVLA